MDTTAIERSRSEISAPPRCQDIKREAEDRFRRRGYLALGGVSCDARNGAVYLRGRLPSYYLKQIAQAVTAEVEGVRCVVNQIEVIAPAHAGRMRTRNESS